MMAAAAPMSAATPAGLTVSATQAEQLTGGTWLGAADQVTIHGAAIDSRAVTPGCVFACLAGARVDGHDFAATAVGDGAVLVLASRLVNVPVPVLLVNDVTAALTALAREFRRRYDPTCVWFGVGGANGKTTTKELLAAACGGLTSGVVHATRGNLNNHLGVPLTVLATPPGQRFCVIELGANHPGEVAHLATIAQPHIGLVVSIGPEHLEGFGSLVGVAQAEYELLSALPPAAPAFVGVSGMEQHAAAHGTSVAELQQLAVAAAAGRSLTFIGGDGPGHVLLHGQATSDGITVTAGAVTVRLPLLGQHNIANTTLAIHAALAAGVSPATITAGLATVVPVAGRLVPRRHGPHVILDDSYNANPASMLAGLQVLAAAPGRRLAVLGAMGELGDASHAAHVALGQHVAQLGLPLVVVGSAALPIADGYRTAGGPALDVVAERAAAVAVVQRYYAASATPVTVLVKASRSAGLEHVVRGVLEGPFVC